MGTTGINLIFGVLGLLGGYFIKYILDKRGEAESRRFADKREHYRNLILAIKSLGEGGIDHEQLFWFERAFLWLYASDGVLQRANEVASRLRSSPADLNDALGDLMLAVRRDMGFKATKITPASFHVEIKKVT